ncbi:MAG TPA: DUF3828 domain-containing protein [Pseudolabrys sp.]|jgi:hypothetical protein
MTTRRLLIATLVALIAAPPLALAASSPDAPIVAIYKKAAAGKGESGGQFVYLEKRDRPRWLSTSLTTLWNAEEAKTPEGDETPPGFDPVSNSQDPKVFNVKVAIEKNDGKSATVAASFDSWSRGMTREEQERTQPDPKDRITVRYDMVLEHGGWKIDEIRGTTDGKEWSIRAILKHFNGD